MKRCVLTMALLATVAALGQELAVGLGDEERGPVPPTLVLESRAAVERAVGFMIERQQTDGSWLHSPPVTGLGCMALHGGVAPAYGITRQMAVEKGHRFLLANVREDGAICPADRTYANYSTAICLSALAVLANPRDIAVMQRAREFLLKSQLDEDHAQHPTPPDNPYYGGIGYGSAGPTRPDLSNTQWALEALYLTDHLSRPPYTDDESQARRTELAWDKALRFLAAVQNLERKTGRGWLVSDKADGGFNYTPETSKAGEKYGEQGGLRSYGSMTYAGLKSMIYAQLERDDQRVQAALDWARRHYTLDENPGMGSEGHFYYLLTFAKAMAACGDDTIVTDDGVEHAWRVDLIRTLLGLQQGDGSWINRRSGRWQESVPELVTSYALLGMEIALGDQLCEE